MVLQEICLLWVVQRTIERRGVEWSGSVLLTSRLVGKKGCLPELPPLGVFWKNSHPLTFLKRYKTIFILFFF